MARRGRALGTLIAIVLAASCAGGTPSVERAPRPSPSGDSLGVTTNASSTWPTYHRTNTRTADAGVNAPWLTGTLRTRWSRTLDGAVYGQAILVGTAALVATEHNTVYSLSITTGATLWSRHLGTPVPRSALPCGNIDPLGITGTPAYDRATGSVFVVAETTGGVHTLYALAAATGTVRWQRNLDVLSNRNKLAEQQRSALLVTSNRVITSFGGLAGDCGNYVGYLNSVPTSGQGSTVVYAIPTAREAGMWAAGGQVVGPNGLVYAASGNGAATSGTWDGSDSVISLHPTTLLRSSLWHPSTWADDNLRDLDLGSLAPVSIGGKILIAGKRGVVYLLSDRLALLASRSGCVGFGGAAVRGSTAYLPCTTGLRAVKVGTASLSFSWQAAGIPGSPVLSGPVAYVLAPKAETLYEVSLATGLVLRKIDLNKAISRFASPTVANGGYEVLVPTMTGLVAVI